MKKCCKGSVTIFLALIMVFFLSFCMVLVEGARMYYFRVEAEQAMELAEFSVLSEYQYELFSHYGVFFIDMDYELGTEQAGVMEKRVETYLLENISELSIKEITIEKLQRASDGEGTPFFQQAAELMKVQSGYKIFEELSGRLEESLDIGALLEKKESEAEKILEESVEKEEPLGFEMSLPNVSFPSVKALSEAVFGDPEGLSEKEIVSEECLLKRQLEKGCGSKEKPDMTQLQLFHNYLLKYFGYYGDSKEGVWKESLEYQLEYIIAGKEKDLENLENIMWRIFLLRAGGNYLCFHQDPDQLAAARSEAIAIAGISGNEGLIKAVEEILLIAKAVEVGIQETKSVFAGEKVPFYEQGVFAGIEFGYEEYLYLFLNMTKNHEKVYRCMDVVEREVQHQSGYESFRLDHCTDGFSVIWNYQFDSLFLRIPFMNGGNYEGTILRRFDYER